MAVTVTHTDLSNQDLHISEIRWKQFPRCLRYEEEINLYVYLVFLVHTTAI